MPKKQKINKEKIPSMSGVTIFGIFSFDDNKLIYVALSEEDVWFEFDTNMYEEDKYAVVKLNVKL
jgi:hypothetical protein